MVETIKRKRPKVICIIIPVHYLASKGGGAESQIKILMEVFNNKKDYEIHFLCRRIPVANQRDQHIWKIGSEEGLGRHFTFIDAKRINNALKTIKPDIIYQNVGCAYTGIAAWYAKKNKAKLLWHIASDADLDGTLIVGFQNRLKGWIDRRFLNYGIKNASIIAAQTEYQSTLLQRKFGRKADGFVPIGHPLPAISKKSMDKITVLWVAGVKPLKQPELFVKMAESLNKIKNVEFIMMGSASAGKWYSDLLKEIGIVQNLKYLGLVSQDEVNQRLSEGHILVNTSRYEGFSNTFIQAWMREVPVVSLNVDPDDILVRKEIGFHSGTFEQLCKDVRTLIANPELRNEMGGRARKYSAENHTVEKMANSLISFFDSM